MKDVEEKAIQMRNMMLFKFSKIYSAAVKYITVDERNVKGSVS
jgi:hypothetical protein